MAPHNEFAEQFQDQALDQQLQKEQYFQQQSYNNHPFKSPHGFQHGYNSHEYDNHHNFNNEHHFENGPKIPVVFPSEEVTVNVADIDAAISEAIVTTTEAVMTTTEASIAAVGDDLGGIIDDALVAISGNSTGSAVGVGLEIAEGVATEIEEVVTEIAEAMTEGEKSSFDLATTIKNYYEHGNGEIDSGLKHHFNDASHSVDFHNTHADDDDEKKYLTLIIILAVMVVLALIALGIYLYKKRQNSGFNQMSGVNVVGKAYEPGRFGENEKKSAQTQGEHSKGASSTHIDERQLKHTESTPIKGVNN